MDLAAKAARFLARHDRRRILLLPNAWDAASARIFEDAGFEAIATTSAGVANSLGYPDGQVIPRAEMIAAIARIARAVDVPVTADLEAGYGTTPEEVAETARLAMEAGAVGMNVEDDDGRSGMREVPQQAEIVRAVKEAAQDAGLEDFVVNARTDVLIRRRTASPAGMHEAIRRLRAYRDAGADCVFAPGVVDTAVIEQIVRGVDAPLNVLATAGTPSVAMLQRIGVARISIGSGGHRATLTAAQKIAHELLREGTFGFTREAIPYDVLNALIRREH
jgi:2-methylisocitrate lyase-like PEP mutase family enzyme